MSGSKDETAGIAIIWVSDNCACVWGDRMCQGLEYRCQAGKNLIFSYPQGLESFFGYSRNSILLVEGMDGWIDGKTDIHFYSFHLLPNSLLPSFKI